MSFIAKNELDFHKGKKFLLNNAMYAMPIIAIIAGIVALVLNFDKVKEKVTELWNTFSEKFPGLSEFVTNLANTVKNALGGALEWVSKKIVCLLKWMFKKKMVLLLML